MKKKRNIQCFWQKNFYILKEHKRENIRVHILYISFFIIPPEFPLFSENIPFTTFREGGWCPCVVEWFYLHTTERQEEYRFSILNPLRKKSRNIQMEKGEWENWATKFSINDIWRSRIWISTSVPNTSESFSYYPSSSCWHPSYNFIYIFDKLPNICFSATDGNEKLFF